MSRHNRNVPTTFYTRFAQDARVFADEHAAGRIISVLEGGYSDLALISGTGAFLEGLAVRQSLGVSGGWWEPEHLEQVCYIHVSSYTTISHLNHYQLARKTDETYRTRCQAPKLQRHATA